MTSDKSGVVHYVSPGVLFVKERGLIMVMEEVGPLLVSVHKWALCGYHIFASTTKITSGFILACFGGSRGIIYEWELRNTSASHNKILDFSLRYRLFTINVY